MFPIKATQIFSEYVQPMVQALHILWSMKNRCHYERCLKTPYGTFSSKGFQLKKNPLHENFLSMFVISCGCTVPEPVWFVVHLPCKIDVVNSMD